MQVRSHVRSTSSDWGWTLGYAALTLPNLALAWGFSVDDAWIVRQVVQNGLAGHGFNFNPGEATDAVTPLGFAHLVAGVSWAVGWEPLLAARVLGLLGWGLALVLAAQRTVRMLRTRDDRLRGGVVWALGLGTCLPAGAWAGAGLETGMVTGILTAGLLAAFPQTPVVTGWGRRVGGTFLLGVAAALRPELLAVGAGALVLARLHRSGPGARTGWGPQIAAFLLPLAVVAGARQALFGTPVPLSAIAKAPSLSHGLRYLIGGLVLVGPLWLLLAGLRKQRPRPSASWLVPAHGVSVLLAGGDWMPLFRLWVPVLPWVLVLATPALSGSTKRLLWLVPALAANLLLWFAQGRDARQVVPRREALIAQARPLLDGARVVAAVDIGWVSAATSASIVDLAGVTDPRVARLPGGHTTKQLSAGFFSDREVDTWVMRLADDAYHNGDRSSPLRPSYGVDAWLLRQNDNLGFEPAQSLLLEGMPGGYVILRHKR